ncbi:hypothetical protein M3Y95_00972100 [Aphelenchoides besseyi]|nr:hypothetical protein M3Y95_00972100 [Aphelenchoides besseyi]
MTSNYTVPILRVLFAREYPSANEECRSFPHLKVSKRCPFPGLFVEIMNLIAEHLNSTIEVHEYITDRDGKTSGFDIGKIENGRVSGLMGEVYNNFADTIAYPFQNTTIRSTVFDFSTPLYYSECQILHGKKTNQSNTLWTFFNVYDKYSMAIMLAILFLQALFYVGNQCCQQNEYEPLTFRQIIDSIWLAVQIQLGQATTFCMKTLAVKFNFLFVSLLQGVIVMGVYSSWILSQKLSVDRSGDLNSFAELVDAIQSRQRYFVSTTASDWFYESLNVSDTYPYNSLRNAIKINPIRLTRTQNDVLEEASNGGGLIALMQDDRLNLLSKQKCNLVVMDSPVSLAPAHLIFRKNSPLIPAVNEAIVKNQMLIMRAFRKYMDVGTRLENGGCAHTRTPVDRPYFGLCIAWVGLMIVASGICFIECIVSIIRRHQKQNHFVILTRSKGCT